MGESRQQVSRATHLGIIQIQALDPVKALIVRLLIFMYQVLNSKVLPLYLRFSVAAVYRETRDVSGFD